MVISAPPFNVNANFSPDSVPSGFYCLAFTPDSRLTSRKQVESNSAFLKLSFTNRLTRRQNGRVPLHYRLQHRKRYSCRRGFDLCSRTFNDVTGLKKFSAITVLYRLYYDIGHLTFSRTKTAPASASNSIFVFCHILF